MTTLADLILQLQADARRAARERKTKTRPPYHASVGRAGDYGMQEFTLSTDGRPHTPLLYEERATNH